MRPFILPVVALCSMVIPTPTLYAHAEAMLQMQAPGPQTQPNEPGRPSSPVPSLQDSSGSPGDSAQQMKDKMFLRDAAQGGLAEVELGKLAIQKGSSEEVQAFGKKMVEDHTKLNEQLAQLADTIGARLPKKMGKDQQAEYDKLSALSGEDFDREYITFMVKDHHKDLREFRMESSTTHDTELKAAVDEGARMVREHMIAADKMAHARGIQMPGHPHHPSDATPPQPPPQ